MMYHAVQIILNHGLLRCCEALLALELHDSVSSRAPIGSSADTAEKHLVRLTNLVCASIPYLLGEVDINGQGLVGPYYKGSICYNMIWPLALVAESCYATENQVQRCKGTLEQIRFVYGINLAKSAQDAATSFWSY